MVNHARKSGYIFEYRITILGSAKVGKTSLLNRYTSETFTHRYLPTTEDHVTHVVDHHGNMCVCLFVDTCGRNDFPAMKKLAIKKGNGFIIVYSIDDKKSFEEAKKSIREIQEVKEGEDTKIILIGNKKDLYKERKVNYKHGRDLLQEMRKEKIQCNFFEVSALENDTVNDPFNSLLDLFLPQPKVTEETKQMDRKMSFTRMSIRRKKKSDKLKQQEQVRLGVRKSLCYSDTDLLSETVESNEDLLRSTEALETKTSTLPRKKKSSTGNKTDFMNMNGTNNKERFDEFQGRNSTPFNLIKSKFGSLQKIFRPESPKMKKFNSLNSPTPSRCNTMGSPDFGRCNSSDNKFRSRMNTAHSLV